MAHLHNGMKEGDGVQHWSPLRHVTNFYELLRDVLVSSLESCFDARWRFIGELD